MSRRLSAMMFAGLGAGLMVVAGGMPSAGAADLPYEERYGSAYEDPRYADLYGREPARPKTYTYRYEAPPPPPPVDYGYRGPPIPRERVYRDEPRYGDYRPRDRYAGRDCTPKDLVRSEMEREGWHGFHDPQVISEHAASIKARRPSGRLFELRVDRCSGEILSSRPLEPRHVPYADRYPRPYRY